MNRACLAAHGASRARSSSGVLAWRILVRIAAVTVILEAWGTAGEAAGPWRGQVVDAENGRPLEAVVVLAIWDKISPGVIHSARDFHDVDELVTDAQGRFVVPARRKWTLNPFVSLDGPKLLLFKPGYGRSRIREASIRNLSNDEWRDRMVKSESIFELPPLKSVEERRKALPSPPSGASYDRIPRFMDAIDSEAVLLGLSPLRRRSSGGQP